MSFAEDLRRSIAALRAHGPETARIAERLASRSCGPCRACCTVKAVLDYEPLKPAWKPCDSLCARGCSIYRSRPKSCVEYLCAWRLGLGGSDARPDRCGVVVDLADIRQPMSSGGHEKIGVIGVTIHGTGKPFDPAPIGEMMEDASRVGIRFFAFANPEDEMVPTDLRFDGDEKRVNAALIIHSTTGRAPTGWSKPVPPPKEPSK